MTSQIETSGWVVLRQAGVAKAIGVYSTEEAAMGRAQEEARLTPSVFVVLHVQPVTVHGMAPIYVSLGGWPSAHGATAERGSMTRAKRRRSWRC